MNNRKEIFRIISSRTQPKIKLSKQSPDKYFGHLTFNDSAQREELPKDVYKKLKDTIKNGSPLDASTANQIANAMKGWAITQGATHYTHWFQPLTGSTAEKHDAFFATLSNGTPIMEFSGNQLIQGEPDASSFPSGGIRQTFEARGYTAWDPTSPAFIFKSDAGATLFVPTAFCSYSGEALDMKTPLLRSQECLSKSAVQLLKLLGRDVKKVYTTAGLEQEYFIIDAEFYHQRPDIIASGRTLFGNSPLKGQELADHYFGAINQRVLNFMQDSEKTLYELGVPIKTRHNEVAPNQYEVAPIFENANLAIDHNLLIMAVMKNIAANHNLRMLTHEKPFKGINGSGKHCNWSMSDSEGQNLLDPGDTPHKNLEFIVFLAAMVRAIDRWAYLLRISIASASNDHRLGAHEAPPAILSVFLGDKLTKAVEDLVENNENSDNDLEEEHLQLGVSVLPPLPKDNSDRNRTCPFAFTGNKFEFRSLGSKQNASAPNYTLNTAVAESIDFIHDQLASKLKSGHALNKAVTEVVRDIFKTHRRVIYNGDGYSEEWQQEAAKRGLPNLRTLVHAVKLYDQPDAIKLFEKYGVMSKREIVARKNVRIEKYNTEIMIEVRSMLEIAKTMIVPGILKHQKLIADSINSANKINKDQAIIAKQKANLYYVQELIVELLTKTEELETKSAITKETATETAEYIIENVRPAMSALRAVVDKVELAISDEFWPLPKYREILSIL